MINVNTAYIKVTCRKRALGFYYDPDVNLQGQLFTMLLGLAAATETTIKMVYGIRKAFDIEEVTVILDSVGGFTIVD